MGIRRGGAGHRRYAARSILKRRNSSRSALNNSLAPIQAVVFFPGVQSRLRVGSAQAENPACALPHFDGGASRDAFRMMTPSCSAAAGARVLTAMSRSVSQVRVADDKSTLNDAMIRALSVHVRLSSVRKELLRRIGSENRG